MTSFLEPASAIAVAKCLISRSRPVAGLALTDSHPRICAWEDFSRADLSRMLDDFNAEAGYDARTNRYRSAEVERFRALAHDHQTSLIQAAQHAQEDPR